MVPYVLGIFVVVSPASLLCPSLPPLGPDLHNFCTMQPPLESTLVNPLVSVENKRLMEVLSPVESTLTKNRGEGGVTVSQTDRAHPRQIGPPAMFQRLNVGCLPA